MQTTFLLVAAAIYLVCAALPSSRATQISAGTAIAWVLHGVVLSMNIFAADALRLGFAMMLSATLWISVASYWLENRNFSLDGLRVLVLPCAAVSAVLPLLFPGNVIPLAERSIFFSWHIAIALLAYSTLTIAAFHAILMAVQESRLHRHPLSTKKYWLGGAIDRLPALLTMERLLFRLIAFGFVLLSLTVLSGIFFSEELFGKPFNWDHKTAFTLLSWILFGILLVGHKWRGWRGRVALRFTLTGFTTLLLAYVGSRFVLEVVLHKGLA
jgi:ABC-type uncharacterized transport system permease subunit